MAFIDPNAGKNLQDVIDSAKTKAFQRGAREPDWNDVWLSVAENRYYGKVLAERGVMVGNLAGDLAYISKFGTMDEAGDEGELPYGKAGMNEKIQQVYADIQSSLDAYLGSYAPKGDLTEEKRMLAFFLRASQLRMEREQRLVDPAYRELMLRAINSMLQELAEGMALGGHGQDMKEADLRRLASIMQNALALRSFSLKGDGAIEFLEEMAKNPLKPPSAIDVVESLIGVAGDLHSGLLYRNGMLSDDPYMKDELGDLLPHRVVQGAALEGLDFAYNERSRFFDERHMAMALLGSSDVMIHLNRIGIRDLQKFREKVNDVLFELDHARENAIRMHPHITPETKGYIAKLDGYCREHKKDRQLSSGLLLKMCGDYPQVAEALKDAGLTGEMMAEWKKIYEEKSAADSTAEDDKKARAFEIPDREFEELVAEYCTDYTKLAAAGKFDPMIGNEKVMEEVETTLLKRGKKNPIIIGEPGIGKTKILEGYAQRIVAGQVPAKLVGSRLLSLDLHSINTSPFVGVFESRILPILKGAAERNASGLLPPIQIAIDEFGNAMDAGAHSKGEGAKALLKPYLTSGDLFVIATTTREEYQTKVQKDPALARRFTPVSMAAPTEKQAAEIVARQIPLFEKDHGLKIDEAMALRAAEFAERYIHQVNHPDKTLDLFDLACALAVKAGDAALEEKHLVRAASSMSNIPESFLSAGEKQRYAVLPDTLKEAVFDQDQAVAAVAGALQRAKAGLRTNPEAPIGNFLFVGPTGVGKTELTRALARTLFGSEDFLTRFDMSEFMEKHTVSRLVGAPPGYVGYDEGGVLVKAVRAKPYSVNLFDEIEKAHQDVYNVLLSPFESGRLTDGRGMTANMSNNLNIMTTNLGAAAVMAEGERRGLNPLDDPESWQEMARPIYERAVREFFRPEFLNRLDGIIYFNSLSRPTIERLVDRQIGLTERQLKAGYNGIGLDLAAEFRKAVADEGFDVRYGARPLKRVWQNMVTTPLSEWLLRQDESALRTASRIIVTAQPRAVIDAEAEIQKAMAEDSDGKTLQDRMRRAQKAIDEATVTVPRFTLA